MESKDKIIDGKGVKVSQLPATYANPLFTKVLKYFGSGLIQLFGQLKNLSTIPEIKNGKASLLDLDLDWIGIAAIVNDFSSKLTPEEWQDFCLKILAYTDINSERITDEAAFNKAFTGKLLFMIKVLVFTLEVNFGDFFGESGIGNMSKPPMKIEEKSAA